MEPKSIRNSEFQSTNFGKGGDKIVIDVRDRMKKVGMTQVEMILELQKQGVTVQPPEMSQILSGVNTYPKAKRVLELCDKILTEKEAKE